MCGELQNWNSSEMTYLFFARGLPMTISVKKTSRQYVMCCAARTGSLFNAKLFMMWQFLFLILKFKNWFT